MKFQETRIPGAFVIDLERRGDDRGFFARTFCATELAQHGLTPHVEQTSVSFSPQQGTLRGMHYQAAPHREVKIVRCVAGAVFDVVVDLRADSPAYMQWFGMELDAERRASIYVPEGCAHGFVTLSPNAEVLYMMSLAHAPEAARGVRWDDPKLAITWPVQPTVISDRDRAYDLL